jgi:hypothetical protein
MKKFILIALMAVSGLSTFAQDAAAPATTAPASTTAQPRRGKGLKPANTEMAQNQMRERDDQDANKTPEQRADATVARISKQVGNLSADQAAKVRSFALTAYTEIAALKAQTRDASFKDKRKAIFQKMEDGIRTSLTADQAAKLKPMGQHNGKGKGKGENGMQAPGAPAQTAPAGK